MSQNKLKQQTLLVTSRYSQMLRKNLFQYFLWPLLAHYEKSQTGIWHKKNNIYFLKTIIVEGY